LKQQYYIKENIFNTCADKGLQIVNLDIKPGKGVDVAGDICREEIQLKLQKIRFSAVFLFNILEHVTDIQSVCSSIEEIVPKGGYVLFSGPYIYPKHLDPIDNLFRPKPKDLKQYFNALDIVESTILKDYTYSYYLYRDSRLFIGTLVRILSPFYKFNKWRTVVIPKLRYLNKNYEVTCVLLRKNG
jgi:SAM-dependent methyltransferase